MSEEENRIYQKVKMRVFSACVGATTGLWTGVAAICMGGRSIATCLVFVPLAAVCGLVAQCAFADELQGDRFRNFLAFCLGSLASSMVSFTILYVVLGRVLTLVRTQ